MAIAATPDVGTQVDGDCEPDVGTQVDGDCEPGAGTQVDGDCEPDVGSQVDGDVEKSAQSGVLRRRAAVASGRGLGGGMPRSVPCTEVVKAMFRLLWRPVVGAGTCGEFG